MSLARNGNTRELLLTADKRFSSAAESGAVVALGRWCLDDPAEIEPDATLLPYVFDDREELANAYHYLNALYKRLLPKLARKLDELHGGARSERFWEILIGYWLRAYLEILYERYRCVLVAKERVPGASVKILDSASYITTEDGLDFDRRPGTDLFNHQLYSQIIELIGGFQIEVVTLSPQEVAGDVPITLQARAKKLAKNTVRWICALGSRWNSVFLSSLYLPGPALLSAAIRLRIFPTLDMPYFRVSHGQPVDQVRRAHLASIEGEDDFERLAVAMLPVNLPKVYIEGLEALRKRVGWFYPKRVRLIATGNSFAVNDGFKLWTAEQTEHRKTPYVIVQHGGNYGCAAWNSSEDYETSVADHYLTFGWTDRDKPSVERFYSSRLPAPPDRGVQGNRNGSIVWVLASLPRYSYTMYSVPAGPQHFAYLEEQVRFLKALSPETRRLIRCRPYPISYGWRDMDFIRRQAGPVELDDSRQAITARFHKMRLLVCTYNATAHLEAFAANVPTLVYWNPDHWELREDARALHEELRRLGILHDTPESAAEMLGSIAGDTIAWWSQPEIQDLRAAFCDRFARSHPQPAEVWSDWIRRHKQKI